jgi:hypothetical protein
VKSEKARKVIAMTEKSEQTIYERAEISEKAIYELRKVLKGKPVEVLGHIDSLGLCCGGGTVAIVKVDLDEIVNPDTKK